MMYLFYFLAPMRMDFKISLSWHSHLITSEKYLQYSGRFHKLNFAFMVIAIFWIWKWKKNGIKCAISSKMDPVLLTQRYFTCTDKEK